MFDKHRFIDGHYALEGDRLEYQTSVPHHMYAVVHAMRTQRKFKVTASRPHVTEFTGIVKSANRVPGTMPRSWKIVMVVGEGKFRKGENLP